MKDVDFLALLVHHGHLPRERARELVPELEGGADLDGLLAERLGWEPGRIARLRRTRAGEVPEIPGYRILELVGEGGTARVFLAREEASRRNLALKVLKPAATRDARTRKAFIQEAKLLQRLAHPGLVRGFGVARSGDTFFSRLEFVQGATLLERLDRGEAFDEAGALSVVLEVAEVLRYLEGQGVVHRDVKPGNVMVTGEGRVVLIDLGFAAGEEHAAGAGADSAVGTVAYLSPEQARGGAQPDIRSDIYSLGISLFQLLVGRLPFESSDDREVLRMQVMESLASPELKGRAISPHVQYFIEKMMAKEAADRYQHWGELIDDVRGQLEGRDALDFERDPGGSAPRRPRRRERP